jgi:PAS domain S-box-containing protein
MRWNKFAWLAWVLLAALLLAMVGLWITRPPLSFESNFLILVLNFLFSTLESVYIAYLIGRVFLARGSLGLLVLGCGILTWGAAGVVANVVSQGNPNFDATIHNLGVWLSGLFHLAGTTLLLRTKPAVRMPAAWLSAAYVSAVGAVGLIALLALHGYAPIFFVPGEGGSLPRQLVLGSSIGMFLLTALLTGNQRPSSAFTYWYALALIAIAIGLLGILPQSIIGGLLPWVGRTALYVGGVYMLVAALAAVREAKIWGIPLEESLRQATARLAEVFESISDGFVAVDAHWRYTYVNNAAERNFGKNRSELLGKSVWEVSPEAIDADAYKALQKADTESTFVEFEHYNPVTQRWFRNRAFPAPDGGMTVYFQDVTDRKRMEEALRRQKEENERLLQTLPAVVWVAHDPECRTVTGNDCANRLLNLPSGTNVSAGLPVYEQGWGHLLHNDGRVMVAQEMPLQRTIATGTDLENIEFSVELRDRRTVHLLGNAAPLYDHEGRVRGAVASCLDISALKAAENRLRENEERLRQITDLVPFGAWTTDENGNPTYLSPLFLDMVGQTLEEHARAWADTIHPDDAPATVAKWREFVETGGEWKHEFRMRGKDGEYRTILACGFPVRDAEGRVTEFVGINYDITERKRQEETLRANEERLRLALDSANMGSWDWSFTTGENNWSAKTRELFGVDTDAPITLDLFLSCLHPDDVEPNRRIAEKRLATGEYQNEYRVVLPGGAVRWIASRGRLQPNGQNQATRMLGVVTDITERRRLEEENQHQSEALRAADRRKDEFLATLAHELRNPLAPLQNSLELLRRAEDNKAVIEFARGTMERQVSQLVRLVDDLLDVSRITKGKLQLRKERVELRDVLNIAIESARTLIETSAHELTVTMPHEPIYVQADLIRLAQVFLNLLNNAAKYTDKAGHIWLTAQRWGNEAVVAVRDTGIGIPTEHLSQVFEMFSQVTSALERSEGGLGIGLSLVKGLVELHGGTIDARSGGSGLGSEFTVRLPIVDIRLESPHEPSGGEEVHRFAKHCILVVDDLRDSADSMAMILRMMGHETRTAYDGLEAVHATAVFQPSVALLDIGLPKMNGYEVARHIREQPWGGNVALVALTGWGQDEDKRRAREAGFDHHLTKPVKGAALEKLLATLAPVSHP